MNLKELMLNYLREEGFCPKEEEFGLAFKCEGLGFPGQTLNNSDIS